MLPELSQPMAHPEHLDLLTAGIRVWNRWRQQNAHIRPNLRAADLKGVDLAGFNLRQTYLSGADLSRAYLFEANLRETNLQGANLSHCCLIGADLTQAYLANANLYHAYLSQANLTETYFGHGNLEKANLSNSVLDRAYFGQANIQATDFSGAQNVDPLHLRLAQNFELAILTAAADGAKAKDQTLALRVPSP